MVLTKLAIAFALLACLLAAGISHIQSTIWWAGYDIRNCPGCKSTIDWSKEIENDAVVSADRIRLFKEDGVVVLPSDLRCRRAGCRSAGQRVGVTVQGRQE